MNPWYKDYAEYLASRWPGVKVQKLSVDAGFSCPNRDGTIGRGGCIYCDNRSFTPRYCSPRDSVARQIAEGKRFFSRKYPQMKYLAYFQSFTGTHSDAISSLAALYDEAAAQSDIVGLIIGTRPDALPPAVLDLLEGLNKRLPVIVEIGAESAHDHTLSLINRGHTWLQVEQAVSALNARGLECGLHLIAGLPGESADDVRDTVGRAAELPVSSLKLHQLQIIRGTTLHRMHEAGEIDIKPFSLEEYLDLCVRVVGIVPRHIAIERFLASAPPEMVVAPRWGLKNYEFTHLLLRRLKEIYGENPAGAPR
jgi:hypothetical protein